MLFSAMVPDGTSKLGFCLGNTVPQAPDLIIRQAFHEKRDKLSAGQSQVTSISNFLTGCAPSSPSRSLPTPQFALHVLHPDGTGRKLTWVKMHSAVRTQQAGRCG